MEMVKLLIFIISILGLPPNKATSQPVLSKCLQNETDPNTTHLSTYGNWCYFIVDGSWNTTNEPTGNGSYLFNISMAREICEAEGATLPIIHNMEENKHISGEYHKFSIYLALGLKQATNGSGHEYKWDDGSSVAFKPPTWDEADEQAVFTVLESSEGWKNLGPIQPVLVGIVCQQLLQPLTSNSSIKDFTEIVCDRNQTPEVIETAIFEHGNTKACYFILTDGSADANRQENGTGSFFFNITAARDVCTKHNATLPSIHSFAEDSFLGTKFFNHFYSIGLKQIPIDGGYKYKWDDGSEFDYQPVWTSKYQPANYTLSEYEGHIGGPRQWHNALDQESLKASVHVICKQSYPPKPKPPVRNISICNDPHKQNYSMTAVFRGQWCYFVIKGGTSMSHKVITERSYFFYPSIGREICKKEGATLPTIANAEEEKFVMENFKSELFKVEIGTSGITRNAEFILLGLNQIKNISDYQWADGTPFLFESSNWTTKAQYALCTIMYLKGSLWISLNSVAIPAPIGVLCKKPHIPGDVVITTEVITRPAPTVIPSTMAPLPTKTKPEPEPEAETSAPESPKPSPPRSPEPKPSNLPKEANKCLPENSHHYTKVAQSGKLFCYFIVPGLNEYSNNQNKHWFKFDADQANIVCIDHGGRLPILFNEEDKFILDNFPHIYELYGATVRVALGLQGERDKTGGVRVTWYDGVELAYFEPGHLITQIEKFKYSIMYQSGGRIKWKPGGEFEPNQVDVVCQQVLSGGNRLVKPFLVLSMAMAFLMM